LGDIERAGILFISEEMRGTAVFKQALLADDSAMALPVGLRRD
jgi:hypothetical protein